MSDALAAIAVCDPVRHTYSFKCSKLPVESEESQQKVSRIQSMEISQ